VTDYGIAGAGLSGAVVARQLAEAGRAVAVYERRDHIGGNCHTERHPTGVNVHRYGPHIFHTADPVAWEYVNRFADMVPYRHKVKAIATDGHVYSLPVNLHTINQAFGTTLHPEQAQALIADQALPIPEPRTFEEAALASVGRRLYELFFEGYTQKQWGRHPSEIPASVFRRLPVRFDYNDEYFNHPWQAIPRDGYTPMIAAMLDHPNITVNVGTEYPRGRHRHCIWTGPLDAYFGHRYGRLNYRTLEFRDVIADGDYQGAPIINYTNPHTAFTRVTEHKHFAPWEQHEATVCSVEYSRDAEPGDEPFYPVRTDADIHMLKAYQRAARQRTDVTFIGRLGTYRYLDMDVTVGEALHAADVILDCSTTGSIVPAFTHKEN
jgi:UDP-galactopyranose mutase